MSTLRMTKKQTAILTALHPRREQSNAQVADAADVSEAYASRVLHALARARLAVYRTAEDVEDPRTHYRLWRRA